MYHVCIIFTSLVSTFILYDSTMSTATAAVILDKRIQKANGTYAIKLRITFHRQKRYYPLNRHMTEEEWERTQAKNPRKDARELKMYFDEIEYKANQVIKDEVPFNFVNFEKAYNQHEIKNEDLLTLLEHAKNRLEKGETPEHRRYVCLDDKLTKGILYKREN